MADVFSDYIQVRAAADYRPAPWAGRHKTETQTSIDAVLAKLLELDLTGCTLEFESVARLQSCLALLGCSGRQVTLANDIWTEFQAWLAAGGRNG